MKLRLIAYHICKSIITKSKINENLKLIFKTRKEYLRRICKQSLDRLHMIDRYENFVVLCIHDYIYFSSSQ